MNYQIKIFEGKIGNEHWIKTLDNYFFNAFAPRKGERIVVEGVVYTVIDIIQDYDLDEFNIFVEKFNYDTGE